METLGNFAEEEKKEPTLGDYVTGNVAEADPNGQTATHEGVIVGEGENNREWKVVDPGRDVGVGGYDIPPNYNVRNIHKAGAKILPVPWSKEKHVEDVRKALGGNK